MMAKASQTSREDLRRGLKERHIQLIALGGTIGVGLFLGSGKAIQTAGPALMLAYVIGGIVIFYIMRALGELVMYRPVSGSFSIYAEEFIGPWAGFFTGWTYWFMWVATGMAEITAVGKYVQFWFPSVPQWVSALVALVGVYVANLIAVRLYGEFEFWFAMIKVITILALIGAGLLMIFTGFGNSGESVGFSNLWSHQGFFPHGITGVLLALQMVMFAYLGVELIGVTAGEAENPEKTLPAAINKVLWRILIFYIGALLVIMSLYPWNQLDSKQSPFVMVFEKIGIPAAAGIINFVVLTAALSSCNSGVFSTGRMLYALAQKGQAPVVFGRVSRQKVPAVGLTVSALVLLIGVLLNYVVPKQVFDYVTSVATVGAIWTWGVILIAHMRYRKAVQEGRIPPVSFRMPGAPWTNVLALLFLVLVVVLLGFDQDTRVALYVAPVWFVLLGIGYALTQKGKSAHTANTKTSAR
jgi:AAT family amino acid transporter/D-serine/D-alanine/glycine transporter